MRRTITDAEFHEQLRDYRHTALRCEMQPAYQVVGDWEPFQRFLSGNPVRPDDDERARPWLDQVARQTAEGRRMERVRIHRDPPTDYQRWLRWTGQWNIRAGERIDYLDETAAVAAGLITAVAQRDWWLFDDNRIMLLTHNESGRRIHTELITDEPELERARAWWHLAVRTARGDGT